MSHEDGIEIDKDPTIMSARTLYERQRMLDATEPSWGTQVKKAQEAKMRSREHNFLPKTFIELATKVGASSFVVWLNKVISQEPDLAEKDVTPSNINELMEKHSSDMDRRAYAALLMLRQQYSRD
jgi:hypothetical protein